MVPCVKAQALPADAGHQFSRRVLAQLGSVDPVKVIEKGTVRLEAGIEILTTSPGQLATDSKRSFKSRSALKTG